MGLQLPLLRLAVLSLTVVAAGCSTIDAEPPPADSPNQLLSDGCDPSYPDFCIPPPPPDLDCKDVNGPFTVIGRDPHGFDREPDGVGCESR